MTPKKELTDLLVHNAFDALFNALKSDAAGAKRTQLLDTIHLVEAKYRELREDEIRGSQAAATIQVRYNQLREKLQEIIADLHRPQVPVIRRKQFWAPLSIFVVTSLGLFWGLWPVKTLHFQLDAQLTTLSVRLLEPYDLNYDLYLTLFEGGPFERVRTADQNITSEAYGPFDWELYDGYFQLSRFLLPQKMRMNLRVDGPEVLLNLADGQVRGELEVDSALTIVADGLIAMPLQHDSARIELIEFTTSESAELALRPAPTDTFHLQRLRVGVGWDYTERTAGGGIRSTIRSGELRANSLQYPLAREQFIEMETLERGYLSIRKLEDVFQIRLRGTATGLRIGDDRESLKAITTTRIEQLAKNRRANLLWQLILGLASLASLLVTIYQGIRGSR